MESCELVGWCVRPASRWKSLRELRNEEPPLKKLLHPGAAAYFIRGRRLLPPGLMGMPPLGICPMRRAALSWPLSLIAF